MPCFFLAIGVFFPRLIIVLLWFFTSWFGNAFGNILYLILGLIFLPLTTLWYGISEYYFSESVQTIGLVIAVLADLGIIGGGARSRRRA